MTNNDKKLIKYKGNIKLLHCIHTHNAQVNKKVNQNKTPLGIPKTPVIYCTCSWGESAPSLSHSRSATMIDGGGQGKLRPRHINYQPCVCTLSSFQYYSRCVGRTTVSPGFQHRSGTPAAPMCTGKLFQLAVSEK